MDENREEDAFFVREERGRLDWQTNAVKSLLKRISYIKTVALIAGTMTPVLRSDFFSCTKKKKRYYSAVVLTRVSKLFSRKTQYRGDFFIVIL